ncbi:beta-galactosidase GalB [Urechidicola sp. KH5]
MHKITSTLLLIILILSFNSCELPSLENKRERIAFDFDWKFQLGDIENAHTISFDDTDWRSLNVPHDWSIEGEYKEDNPAGKAGGFLPTGTGWYRKDFNIESLTSKEKYFIEFDGVYMNSDVYINGVHLGNRPYGYISFSYDLTAHIKEGTNTIAVRADNSKAPSGRWYTGSGIFRHVWLTKTSDIYIPQWGTKVTTPKVSKEKATVKLEATVATENEEELIVLSTILDQNNQQVAESQTKLNTAKSDSFIQEFEINNPNLWSPDTPSMYRIETMILSGSTLKDIYSTPFGIRSIELKPNVGFLLNGEPIKFKGLSNHHDAGPVGAAVPNDVLYRRLKLLKDMGTNALRTTHNPFAPEFYTMCDTMGFMVMDEAFDGWWNPKAKHDYGNYFADWWQQDLTDFIKRDQNHPSVVIWSIGNEVPKFKPEEQKEIIEFAKTVDNTRPYTQGRGYSAPYLDISGFNGHGEYKGALEKYHKQHPEKLIIGTEITHTLQTRGVYRTKTWYRTKDNPAPWEKPHQFKKMEPKVFKIPDLSEEEVFPNITKKYQSSYDNSIVRVGVRDDWNRVENLDYYLGNFRWTGFDYLGESFGWPARTANFGIIDLAGFPKDHYYLYQSLWADKPMVHILPHWTHPGKEGREIPVVVYTNCDSAELFLNNISLGEKVMTNERQLVWHVPYQPGNLKVVAKKDGQIVAQSEHNTSKRPNKIKLTLDKKTAKANGQDVIHVEVDIVDESGNLCPDADNLVEFEIEGPGTIIGVENGDILDLAPHKINTRNAFKGKCLLMIQVKNTSGEININVKSTDIISENEQIIVF